jgi:hypothetical protein
VIDPHSNHRRRLPHRQLEDGLEENGADGHPACRGYSTCPEKLGTSRIDFSGRIQRDLGFAVLRHQTPDGHTRIRRDDARVSQRFGIRE